MARSLSTDGNFARGCEGDRRLGSAHRTGQAMPAHFSNPLEPSALRHSDRGARTIPLRWLALPSAWAVVTVLALVGCDLLDPTKCDNPIFGPPPPRTVNASDKSGHSKIASTDSPPVTASADDKIDSNEVKGAPIERIGFTSGGDKKDSKPMTGNEIVASINGQPIFASEIFERAYPERLGEGGLSLLVAHQYLTSDKVSASDKEEVRKRVRPMQLAAIKRYLRDYIRTRVLAQAMEEGFEKEQKEKVEQALTKMYDDYVDKLKKEFKVESRPEVDKKLHEQGSSLKSLYVEFKNRLMADEYVRGKAKKDHVVGRKEIVDYYESHLEDYDVPERVRWQLLEIHFEKHGGQKGALEALEKAVAELKKGETFSAVVKKFSDGPRADEGGKQPWTRPESIADAKTAATLRQIQVGETSSVLKTKDSFRLVRLIERKTAGRRPLSEVQDEIKRKLDEQLQRAAIQKLVEETYRKSSIESAYLTYEEANTPADDAGVLPTTTKPAATTKKRHGRS